MPAECILTILELNWNQRFRGKEIKLNICHHMLTSSKQLQISRRGKHENVCEMSKNEKRTCKACKTIVFHCQICKFMTLFLPSSSWLRKLPINAPATLFFFLFRSTVFEGSVVEVIVFHFYRFLGLVLIRWFSLSVACMNKFASQVTLVRFNVARIKMKSA